jgi:O-antigen ligase/cytochrome c-type biogenesis protein CcmH/NrfG
MGILLLCAKVAVVPMVFDPAADLPFVVPKAFLSHALAFVLGGVLVGLSIRLGRQFFVWSPVHIPVLAFLGVNIVGTTTAADQALALFGSHSRMLGLGTTVDGVVLYFALVHLVRRPIEFAAVLVSAFAASVPVLGYEVVQFVGRDPFSWSLDSAERPFSSLGQATALAQYLSVLAVGVFTLGLLAPIATWLRAVMLGYSILLLVGTAVTSTRSPLIGLALATFVVVMLVVLLHPSRRARVASIIGAALGALVVAALLVLTPLGGRLASTIEVPTFDSDDELIANLEPSAAARLTLYQIAFEMVGERPIFGYGPDNFAIGIPAHRPDPAPVQVRQNVASSAHSWVAQIATGSGLVGLSAFLAIVVVVFAIAFRRGFNSIGIAALGMLAAFLGTGLTTVNEFGTEWLFWACVGIVASATAQTPDLEDAVRRQAPHRTRGSAMKRKPFGGWIVPTACVAVGALLATTAVTPFAASRSSRASQASRLSGNVPSAIQLGLSATRDDPGRAAYWDTLGLAYVAASRPSDAAAAFHKASGLAPYDVRYLGDETRAQILRFQAGEQAALGDAIRIADQGVQTDPNNPRAQLTKALTMQVAGDLPQALAAAERGLALDPQSNNADLYVTAAQIMTASGRAVDSIKLSRDGIAVLGQAKNSVGLRIELARALMATGQLADALKEIDLALALQPTNPTAARVRADIQAAMARGG